MADDLRVHEYIDLRWYTTWYGPAGCGRADSIKVWNREEQVTGQSRRSVAHSSLGTAPEKNWHKKAQAWGVWNSLKHLSKFADFKQRATTKAVVARMRGSIRDDFQVQMKTKDRAWQRIGGLESRFNEIRLKHPIRYIQWISRLCLHKRYVLTQKKGSDCSEFNFAIMKVFAFSI